MPSRQCKREGCGQPVPAHIGHRQYCCGACRAVDVAMDRLIDRAKESADPAVLAEVDREWLALLDVAEAVSTWRELVASRTALRHPTQSVSGTA